MSARRIDAFNLPRLFKDNPALPHSHANTGIDALRQDAERASQASRQLLNATQSLFRKWETENGFVEGAGQILLPAGYRA